MKRIQAKKHKIRTYDIDKIFDDKRYVLDDGIYTLAYFHKDSVTSCKEIQKGCDKKEEIKKVVIKKKKLKKIVIIKKDCDNKKRLQQKKEISQMIINKQRFKKILIKEKILTDDCK